MSISHHQTHTDKTFVHIGTYSFTVTQHRTHRCKATPRMVCPAAPSSRLSRLGTAGTPPRGWPHKPSSRHPQSKCSKSIAFKKSLWSSSLPLAVSPSRHQLWYLKAICFDVTLLNANKPRRSGPVMSSQCHSSVSRRPFKASPCSEAVARACRGLSGMRTSPSS